MENLNSAYVQHLDDALRRANAVLEEASTAPGVLARVVTAAVAITWPALAKSLEVTDAESFVTAGEELIAVKTLITAAHKSFDPIVEKQYAAWQEGIKQRKLVILPLEEAEAIYKQHMTGYQVRMEEQRRAEQMRLEAAERDRAEAQLEAEIESAEAAGASATEVEAIIDRPLQIAPVVARTAVPQMAGVSKLRDNWQGSVIDKKKLVLFIVQSQRWDLLNLLAEDKTSCNALAKSLRGTIELPGVLFVNKQNMAVRA